MKEDILDMKEDQQRKNWQTAIHRQLILQPTLRFDSIGQKGSTLQVKFFKWPYDNQFNFLGLVTRGNFWLPKSITFYY